jgi:hypothetical protein
MGLVAKDGTGECMLAEGNVLVFAVSKLSSLHHV